MTCDVLISQIEQLGTLHQAFESANEPTIRCSLQQKIQEQFARMNEIPTSTPMHGIVNQLPLAQLSEADLTTFLKAYMALHGDGAALNLFKICLEIGNAALAKRLVEVGYFASQESLDEALMLTLSLNQHDLAYTLLKNRAALTSDNLFKAEEMGTFSSLMDNIEPVFQRCLEDPDPEIALRLIQHVSEKQLIAVAQAFKLSRYDIAIPLIQKMRSACIETDKLQAWIDEELRTVCINGDISLLKIIHGICVETGLIFNPNAQDVNSKSLLHFAAEGGYDELVSYLLAFNANPNLTDTDGNTALHAAGFGYKTFYDDMMKFYTIQTLLRRYKAKEDIFNNDGLTPKQAYEGIYSFTSFERLLGNANGLKDNIKTAKRYEGLSNDFPLREAVQESLNDETFVKYSFNPKELAQAFVPGKMDDARQLDALKRIRYGDLVIVPSGWCDHNIYIVFFKGYMVLCNRGDRPRGEPTIKAYKINLDKFDEFTMRYCLNERASTENAYENFYEELPQSLDAYEDDFCQKLEKLSNKDQKVGNCRFNIKTALRVGSALLSLQAAVESDDEEDMDFEVFITDSADSPLVDKALQEGRRFSKHWSTLFRMSLLDEYVDEKTRADFVQTKDMQNTDKKPRARDEDLIDRSWSKIHKRQDAPRLLKKFPHIRRMVKNGELSKIK